MLINGGDRSFVDPKANSEEMPKYEKFRTWYAEGTQ